MSKRLRIWKKVKGYEVLGYEEIFMAPLDEDDIKDFRNSYIEDFAKQDINNDGGNKVIQAVLRKDYQLWYTLEKIEEKIWDDDELVMKVYDDLVDKYSENYWMTVEEV